MTTPNYNVDLRQRSSEHEVGRPSTLWALKGGLIYEILAAKPKHAIANGDEAATPKITWGAFTGGAVDVKASTTFTIEGDRLIEGTKVGIILILMIKNKPTKIKIQVPVGSSETLTLLAGKLRDAIRYAHRPTAAVEVKTVQVADNGITADTSTITAGPTTYTFKSSGATGNQINIGGSAAATATNIAAKFEADKTTIGIASAVAVGDTVTITGLGTGASFALSTNVPTKLTLATTTEGFTPTTKPTGTVIIPFDIEKVVSLAQISTAMVAAFGSDPTAAWTSSAGVVTATYGTTGEAGNAQRVATYCGSRLPSPLPPISDDGKVLDPRAEGLGDYGGYEFTGNEGSVEVKPFNRKGSVKHRTPGTPELKFKIYQVRNFSLLETLLQGAELVHDGTREYLMYNSDSSSEDYAILRVTESSVPGEWDTQYFGTGRFLTVSKTTADPNAVAEYDIVFNPGVEFGDVFSSQVIRPAAIS